MRTIRKIAMTVMSCVLVIPLWKNAKFWTFAFRDGVHLNEMFDDVQIVRMHTLAWEFTMEKDVIGGKEIQFLVIKISNVRGPRALESLPGEGRCFKQLFGRDCKVCKGTSVCCLFFSHLYLYQKNLYIYLKCVGLGRK
jgi:hypothetical protein